MSDAGQVTAAGGFCAPIDSSYDWANPELRFYYEWTKAERRRFDAESRWQRLRVWFTWDNGWGFPLRGSVPPNLMDLLPTFRAQRGGIRFAIPGDPPR